MLKNMQISILLLLLVTIGATAGEWMDLFDGKTLNGWSIHSGYASYRVEEGAIVGTAIKGSPNTFLCTNKEYGDFILEFEVKCNPRLNSGVQIRSQIAKDPMFFVFRRPDGRPRQRLIPPDRVYGYQVEIAGAESGTSGGIYDEARRGFFLADLTDKPAARKAFKNDRWNKYRIECKGSSIKTWVNDVPCVDLRDSMDSRGIIGLQVHGLGRNFFPYQVRWRNLRIRELDAAAPDKLKVVVVTGGHDFEREPFFKMLDSMKEINYTEAIQKDHSELFEDISGWDYDVIVFYSMTQEISEKRRKNFLRLLDRGIGIVALHHTMGSFQQWPEFRKIIGTKYNLKDSDTGKGSSFKHDIDMTIKVVDRQHPITEGMSNFSIHDEGYKDCWFDRGNQVLLTTDHADSDKTVGWIRKYGKAKICTIQLGHDSKAYENRNYRRLVNRAVLWSAGRL
ncbi:MAG: family 16 glycoside hydrolase [Planctomycetota bacterium]|jgi:type 1 glutamine amidotransferase